MSTQNGKHAAAWIEAWPVSEWDDGPQIVICTGQQKVRRSTRLPRATAKSNEGVMRSPRCRKNIQKIA